MKNLSKKVFGIACASLLMMSMATKSSTTVFEKLSDCEMEAIDVHNDLMDEGWSHQHSYNVSGAYLDLCNYIAAGGTL